MAEKPKAKFLNVTSKLQPTIGMFGKKKVIFFDTQFNDPKCYISMVSLLDQAKEDEVVYIIINSPGGIVASVSIINNAIARCKAKVITVAAGMAASCGFNMWAQGDEHMVGEFSERMCHTSSHGDKGRTGQIAERAEAIQAKVTRMLTTYLDRGIITKEHYTRVVDQREDLYLLKGDLEVDRV